jgi:hypothetical protein
MAQDNTLARSLRDLGLATWFGGSLMGRSASTAQPPSLTSPPSGGGWPTPVGRAGRQ